MEGSISKKMPSFRRKWILVEKGYPIERGRRSARSVVGEEDEKGRDSEGGIDGRGGGGEERGEEEEEYPENSARVT
jgi:hypothetical protein